MLIKCYKPIPKAQGREHLASGQVTMCIKKASERVFFREDELLKSLNKGSFNQSNV